MLRVIFDSGVSMNSGMRTIAAACVLLAVALPATAAHAHICESGFADTAENQASGKCVPLPTPTPTPKPKHSKSTATPVLPTMTSVPTATSVLTTSVPAATPTTQPTPPEQPVVQTITGAPLSLAEYCHREPTTGQWEIRRTTDTTLPGPRPIAPHVCAQPTLPVPLTAASPLATATSAPTVEVVPVVAQTPVVIEQAPPIPTPMPTATPTVCGTDEIDCMPPVVTAEEVAVPMPPVQIPLALPVTGGDDGCSYYETCLVESN